MTTATEAYELLADSFRTAWGSTTPIAWDNMRFDSEALVDKQAGWVRFEVQPVSGDFAGIGTTTEVREGQVVVQVFVAENTGPVRMNVLTEQLARWLAEWPTNAVRIREPSIVHVGVDGNGWYQKNVIAQFDYRAT